MYERTATRIRKRRHLYSEDEHPKPRASAGRVAGGTRLVDGRRSYLWRSCSPVIGARSLRPSKQRASLPSVQVDSGANWVGAIRRRAYCAPHLGPYAMSFNMSLDPDTQRNSAAGVFVRMRPAAQCRCATVSSDVQVVRET